MKIPGGKSYMSVSDRDRQKYTIQISEPDSQSPLSSVNLSQLGKGKQTSYMSSGNNVETKKP
jgi:hypothetical protein